MRDQETHGLISERGPARPWWTLAFGIAAVAVWYLPNLRGELLYDRASIARGEWWRFWSGHVTHHSSSHLFWNLAVFLPAALWLEGIRPTPARLFLGLAPLAISAALWTFEPELKFYAGLSGVTVGALTLLALSQMRRDSGEPRWIWAIVLLLVLGKIVFEWMRAGNAPIFAGLPIGIRNVPLAHLAGFIFAFGVFLASSRIRWR